MIVVTKIALFKSNGCLSVTENRFTDERALARCESMSRMQAVLGGKWKILILWYIATYEVQRFGSSCGG